MMKILRTINEAILGIFVRSDINDILEEIKEMKQYIKEQEKVLMEYSRLYGLDIVLGEVKKEEKKKKKNNE